MLINVYYTSSPGRSADALPLYWWQGWSGVWYVATPRPLARVACPAPGVYVVARREADGSRTPLFVGSAARIDSALYDDNAAALLAAMREGANEIHVHLIGETELDRAFAAEDIARAWGLPVTIEAEPVA